LFSLLDKDKNNYISENEFNQGMHGLFTESFDELVKFVFNFFDFDSDGLIIKEDIQVIVSYIPLQTVKSQTKVDVNKKHSNKADMKEVIESQKELCALINLCFKQKDKLNLNEFKDFTENVSSDIFLFVYKIIKFIFLDYYFLIRKETN